MKTREFNFNYHFPSKCLFAVVTNLAATALFVVSPHMSIAQSTFAGQLKSVTISDTIGANKPPNADFTFTQNLKSFTFDATATTDPDGNIVEYKWDFGDGSGSTEMIAAHTYTDDGEKRVTLTVRDNNGGISILQKAVTTAPPVNIAINFQPSNVPVPTGFLMDSGKSFSDQTGFGWTVSPGSLGTRDRNNSLSSGQEYDTFIHVDPTGVWEHNIANGKYTVTVVFGDPSFPDTIQALQIEDLSVISPTPLSTSLRWIEKTVNVTVLDQRLTLKFAGSSVAKFCWIRISNT